MIHKAQILKLVTIHDTQSSDFKIGNNHISKPQANSLLQSTFNQTKSVLDNNPSSQKLVRPTKVRTHQIHYNPYKIKQNHNLKENP